MKYVLSSWVILSLFTSYSNASTYENLSVDEMQPEAVVVAIVHSQRSGKRSGVVFTCWKFNVLETVLGSYETDRQGRINVCARGGVLDGRGDMVSSYPLFIPNEKVVLTLRTQEIDGDFYTDFALGTRGIFRTGEDNRVYSHEGDATTAISPEGRIEDGNGTSILDLPKRIRISSPDEPAVHRVNSRSTNTSASSRVKLIPSDSRHRGHRHGHEARPPRPALLAENFKFQIKNQIPDISADRKFKRKELNRFFDR